MTAKSRGAKGGGSLVGVVLFLLPVFGAAFVEAAYRYTQYRDLPATDWLRTVKSPLAWTISALFVVVIPLGIYLWRRDDAAAQLLLYGAATPAILRVLINASFDPKHSILGDEDDTKIRLRDHFKT